MIITSLALTAFLSEQGKAADTERAHRSFRFVYDATVPDVPAGAKQVRLWIPVPIDTPDQVISELMVTAKADASSAGGAKVSMGSLMGAKPDELLKDSS